MEKIEFFKEWYFAELNRKNQIYNQHSLPIGTLTVLGGLLGFFALNLAKIDYEMAPELLVCISFILVGVGSLFWLITLVLIMRTLTGYKYSYLAEANKMQSYYNEILKSEGGKKKKADKHFFNELEESLSNCISINSVKNDQRSIGLFIGTRLLYVTAGFLITGAIPFFILIILYSVE